MNISEKQMKSVFEAILAAGGRSGSAHLTAEKMLEYFHGGLSGEEEQACEEHLRQCARCAEEIERMYECQERVKGAGGEARLEEISRELMRRVRDEPEAFGKNWVPGEGAVREFWEVMRQGFREVQEAWESAAERLRRQWLLEGAAMTRSRVGEEEGVLEKGQVIWAWPAAEGSERRPLRVEAYSVAGSKELVFRVQLGEAAPEECRVVISTEKEEVTRGIGKGDREAELRVRKDQLEHWHTIRIELKGGMGGG